MLLHVQSPNILKFVYTNNEGWRKYIDSNDTVEVMRVINGPREVREDVSKKYI